MTKRDELRSAPGKPPSASDPRGTAPPLVQATTPTLPTGGGAIRGIGEKFSTAAVTGTGTLSIPIPATPTRGGFHPGLSLDYDSGSGNGPFGAGWRLSVPAITRKTDKQLPTYDDSEGTDVFVLSGAEDLVPSDEPEPVPPPPAGIEVTRYRPRVEAGFARIERHREVATGETWWVSISPANIRSEYGRTAAARITDPGDDLRVFSWLIERTEDPTGNVVTYEYVEEDLVGVTAEPAETHRLAHLAPITNRYLKAVHYGNTRMRDAASCAFHIVIDYGDHDDAAPALTPDRPWPVRSDPFSVYRAGFEIRTYRRCARVLIFHALSVPELGETPCLVRTLALSYDDDPALAHLVAVEHRGHIRNADGSYQPPLATPALRLGYTVAARPGPLETLTLDGEGDLAGGIDGARHQWVDLDAEGIAGALSDGDGGLYFRRNLGGGVLGPARPLTAPLLAAPAGGGQHLLDVDGDGRLELVALGPPLPGFHTRIPAGAAELPSAARDDGGWDAFQPFAARPDLDWTDPEVRFIDLDGDGRDDVLITKDEHLVWYPSLGKDGFGPPRILPRPTDEDRGPAVVFADASRSILLADLGGDGLRDLVRVENGRICYWPNLGHGRFGAKVTMASAPVFDRPDQFEPRRVLFHDIDGTGTADVIYAGRDGVRYWLNRAGNSWSEPHEIDALPAHTTAASITAVDLLGTGTACLVWSSPIPSESAVRYVDLVGGVKPHLLCEIDNQLGMVTRLGYAASTKFYLADRAAGIRWETQLGFPVHVIERVETYDSIRRVRFLSEYKYRNGYFDGYEREFRGFGYVEQRDTESIGEAHGIGLFADRPAPINGEYPQPPVVTRTWFHTGAWLDDGPDRRCVVPAELTPAESREAYRALRGRPLKQEILAEDGTALAENPYTRTVHGYEVRWVQRAGDRAHGVFYAFERESIAMHYERVMNDPRIVHDVTIELDKLGHVRRSVAIGYGRTAAGSADDPDARIEQRTQLATLTEVDVANETGHSDWYRHGVPLEKRTYELLGLPVLTDGSVLSIDKVTTIADAAEAIPYDRTASGSAKRLVERARTRYYDADHLPAPLPFGTIDWLSLPYESYGLAFTSSLIATLYGTRVTDEILVEGGYKHLDDPNDPDSVTGWWAPSGRSVPDPTRFYLPVEFLDPFSNPPTTVTYDDYLMAVTSVTDAVGNTSASVLDYRLMTPVLVTDPNGNQTRVEADALGRVVALWIMGHPDRSEGDRDPASPTMTFEYAFYDPATGAPSVVHSAARETHGDPATRWQHSYSYSDGAGHEVMKKVQAEPGKAMLLQAGVCIEVDANPRWIGNGRTVVDNKGNPVKQYEPYFSTTSAYEDEAALVCAGVTPILHYDPLGRLILTERADGAIARVVFTPWRQEAWDANDTVGDLGNLWLAQAQASPDAAVRRAAALALDHAGTPSVTHLDTLGRPYAAVADNKTETLETRTTLDIEGNALVVWDALGRPCLTRGFSLLGQACCAQSIDAGDKWSVVAVDGQLVRRWDRIDDTHDRVVHASYDELRRPIGIRVKVGDAAEILAEKTIWGEHAPPDTAANRRTRIYQTYDGAGVATSVAYDLAGQRRVWERQLCVDYTRVPDWGAASPPVLEDEVFTASSEHDALGRLTWSIAPDGTVSWLTYNQASLLDTVQLQIRGANERTTFISNIEYDAKRRRTRIEYGAAGSAAITEYRYDDRTFRLASLNTARAVGPLQDLSYTYDPVGNIVQITDADQDPVWWDGHVVDGTARYWYQPVYRLARADAREHAGGLDGRTTDVDLPFAPLPHPNDDQKLIAYSEIYDYDRVGNLKSIAHGPPDSPASWVSQMHAVDGCNQLAATMRDGDDPAHPETWPDRYTRDSFGNTTSMPHLPRMDWDWKDRMVGADKLGGGAVYFTYDTSGERARKVWEHGALVEERIYLGGYEVYRRRRSGTPELERQTLHVMDGIKRIALVETKTIDADVPAFTPTTVTRFQLGNHLGSVALEIDLDGRVISYEEYHPYGTSAYRAANAAIEVSPRRYRYTGKERDEETSLSYHRYRYYAPWLGRWISPDPAGLVDGTNLFAYVRGQPTSSTDDSGLDSDTHTTERGLSKKERETPPNFEPDTFHRVAQLHGETEARLYTLQRELSELANARNRWSEGKGPVRFWDLEHWAVKFDDEPMNKRLRELHRIIDAGLAKADKNGWYHSSVLDRAVEGGIVRTADDRKRFVAAANAALAGVMLGWAGGRFLEMALVLTPSRGAKGAAAIFAESPPAKTAVVAAAKAVEVERGVVSTAKTMFPEYSRGMAEVTHELQGLKQLDPRFKVAAKVEIGGKSYLGSNAMATSKTSPFMGLSGRGAGHAELDALGQAAAHSNTSGGTATMWITEAPCSGACVTTQFVGDVNKAMAQMGLSKLTIHYPGVTMVFEAGKSVPFVRTH